jgi:hypothetical protein
VAPLPMTAVDRRVPPLTPGQEPSQTRRQPWARQMRPHSPSCIYLLGAAETDPNWPPESGPRASRQRAAGRTVGMEAAAAAASSQHEAWSSRPSEANPHNPANPQNPPLQTWGELGVRPSLPQSPSGTCTPEAAAWSAWPAWPPPTRNHRRASPSRKDGDVELGSSGTVDGGGGLQDERRERAETSLDLDTAEDEAAGGGRSKRRRRALTRRRARSRELPYPFEQLELLSFLHMEYSVQIFGVSETTLK